MFLVFFKDTYEIAVLYLCVFSVQGGLELRLRSWGTLILPVLPSIYLFFHSFGILGVLPTFVQMSVKTQLPRLISFLRRSTRPLCLSDRCSNPSALEMLEGLSKLSSLANAINLLSFCLRFSFFSSFFPVFFLWRVSRFVPHLANRRLLIPGWPFF